jgi:hypothetical protein
MNLVVAHFTDGRIVKGTTNNFLQGKDRFHLLPQGSGALDKPAEVLFSELKALFFVRDLNGDPSRREKNLQDGARATAGRKLRVQFKDGEVLEGTTQGYQPGRPGFFIVPVDPESNNERCFVITAATQAINPI